MQAKTAKAAVKAHREPKPAKPVIDEALAAAFLGMIEELRQIGRTLDKLVRKSQNDLVRVGDELAAIKGIGDTITQGFISGRWHRRAGDIYDTVPAGEEPVPPNTHQAGGSDDRAE